MTDIEHFYPTACVLCGFTGETPEAFEEHMETVHDNSGVGR